MQSINNWFMDVFGMGPHSKWQAQAVKSLDEWKSEGKVDWAKDRIIWVINGLQKDLYLGELALTCLPPVIWQLTFLTRLHLDKIEVLPTEIGLLTNLVGLEVERSRFESLPSEIGKLTSLTMLLIQGKLKSLPFEIGNLSNLKMLRVSQNKLISLPPEIGLCRNLENLSIDHNLDLKELPMSLGQITGLTYLEISDTGIAPTLAYSILRQCQLLRKQAYAALLPSRLHTWKALAGVEFDLLNRLTTAQKIDLNEWLVRLEKTRDFYRSQAKLAKIVCSMLQSLSENEEFKELFFVQVAANTTCCEDRAAMSLNEIYTSWKIICMPDDQLKVMTGVAKTLALRKELAKRIPSGERESVEIYLYYETLLKKHLCTAIEEMDYGQIGKRQWIDSEELLESVNDTYFDHLMDLPVFEKLAKKELKEEWESISNKAQSELTDRPTGDDLSEAVLMWQHNQGKVMQERQRAWSECVKVWYLHAVT